MSQFQLIRRIADKQNYLVTSAKNSWFYWVANDIKSFNVVFSLECQLFQSLSLRRTSRINPDKPHTSKSGCRHHDAKTARGEGSCLRSGTSQLNTIVLPLSLIRTHFHRELKWWHIAAREFKWEPSALLLEGCTIIPPFIKDDDQVTYEALKDCNLISVVEGFPNVGSHLLLNKNSPLLGPISRVIYENLVFVRRIHTKYAEDRRYRRQCPGERSYKALGMAVKTS